MGLEEEREQVGATEQGQLAGVLGALIAALPSEHERVACPPPGRSRGSPHFDPVGIDSRRTLE